VENRERARDPFVPAAGAAVELALDMRAGIDRHLAAALGRRQVEVSGPAAVGRRPEIGAARGARADPMRVLVGNRAGALGIDLDIAARIVIDGSAGLRVDALGPGELLDGLGRLEE